MAKSAKQAPPETPAKPKGKKLLVSIVILLLLGIAGGAGWYFTQGESADEGAKEASQPVFLTQPKFVALAPFTVNLQREDNSDQFLQVGMSLKIFDPTLEDKIKADMPEIRSKLLLLLSSKHASELSSVAGKKKLASEIITQIDSVLGIQRPTPQPAASGVAAASSVAQAPVEGDTEDSKEGIVDVLFTSFIIQ